MGLNRSRRSDAPIYNATTAPSPSVKTIVDGNDNQLERVEARWASTTDLTSSP